MRKTVTLDSDVEALLRNAMRERGISFKQALNEAVRLGIRESRTEERGPFRQKTYRMGFRSEFRWDKAMAIADTLDDEELARKLEFGK